MKLFSVFVIVILLLQVCLGHSFLSNAAKFSAKIDVGNDVIAIDKKHHYKKISKLISHELLPQIIVAMHAQGDARIHQERMCAIEHVELAARGASVFSRYLWQQASVSMLCKSQNPWK
ncbi:hypothetical protein GH714_023235 [Hevea brasiliensis]|uniref:Uncharacterized protein n=1 Tax=Hevea brasiliensis TaxID=3981 RepID=A0A6A6L7I1_HEVBR|nr:hypothetical protein GH714_023235 [Hevea brasiliensis]